MKPSASTPSAESSAIARPPASATHDEPEREGAQHERELERRSQPGERAGKRCATPFRTWPRTIGVTIRQVIAGRKKHVPSVSPTMLGSPKNGSLGAAEHRQADRTVQHHVDREGHHRLPDHEVATLFGAELHGIPACAARGAR